MLTKHLTHAHAVAENQIMLHQDIYIYFYLDVMGECLDLLLKPFILSLWTCFQYRLRSQMK